MRKQCSNVCKLCLCLATESTHSARMRSIVTAALQRQYSQPEVICWITLVYSIRYYPQFHVTTVGLGTYYPCIRGHYCICFIDYKMMFTACGRVMPAK
jgi:hypothetical protein